MVRLIKYFLIFMGFSILISCAEKNKDNLLLDAEGGNSENNEQSAEIEVTDNEVQAIEMEEIELTIEEKLASELIDVGDRVFFEYDESTISAENSETLNKQYQFLLKNPNISITITGHCDERGTREYNLALGERRASAVKNYIVSLGIEPSRITVISYGKEKPTVEGHNDWAWAQNRAAITYINN